jgi:N-methylhydantoinase A
MKAIGVDVGGTFTDFVYCDSKTGEHAIHKVSTTPDDPSIGVVTGIQELCAANSIAIKQIDFVFHGTTTATNAVLENSGALTGLLTNEGFRDILHIGRHQRVEHYSIMQELPWQNRLLIKRRHRKVVKCRIVPPSGDEIEPLDEAGVRRAAREFRDEKVESIAVCFLFSYINPTHEERAREILQEELPTVEVTTSSFVSPQFREFERFTTTALSAFVAPKMRTYIRHLEQAFRQVGLGAELRIMTSNGGVATAAMVTSKPAVTLQSGPAAGVIGGAWIGRSARRSKLITFDMGGTSADIGIVANGQFAESDARSASIAGFPLLLPMIDVHVIGAGGGSIAYLDKGGAFCVGPRSAGAMPGPAAYGRGGTQPTVTDANLILGRLDTMNFLGGVMKLDEDAARATMVPLAASLSMSVAEVAEGIVTVVNNNMANAIRSRTVQKGIDPRDFALVAFGGAGPLHGAAVAEMVGISEVIIPPYPGIASAQGLLATDLKYDLLRTEFQVSGSVDIDKINTDFSAMEKMLAAQLLTDHIPPERSAFIREGDLRYVGQGYELKIPFPLHPLDPSALESIWEEFHRSHAAEYGHAFRSTAIEIVNIRARAIGQMQKVESLRIEPIGTPLAKARVRTGQCMFRVGASFSAHETPFYHRDLLPLAAELPGPAVVLQKDSTTLIPPQATAKVDEAFNIVIRIGKST